MTSKELSESFWWEQIESVSTLFKTASMLTHKQNKSFSRELRSFNLRTTVWPCPRGGIWLFCSHNHSETHYFKKLAFHFLLWSFTSNCYEDTKVHAQFYYEDKSLDLIRSLWNKNRCASCEVQQKKTSQRAESVQTAPVNKMGQDVMNRKQMEHQGHNDSAKY